MGVFLTQIAFVVNAEGGYCTKAANAHTTEKIMIIGSLDMLLLKKTAVCSAVFRSQGIPPRLGGLRILIDKQMKLKGRFLLFRR